MSQSIDEKLDEGLEIIWTNREAGINGVNKLKRKLKAKVGDPDKVISKLGEEKLINIQNESVLFTSEGEKRARSILRRHRLAERLFVDLLEMGDQDIEGPACRFEHAISQEVEEKICTLLGHPSECPHGKNIPRGECCTQSEQMLESAICTLSNLEVGDSVTIAYLSAKGRGRLHKLSTLGVMPGVKIRVIQKFPSFLIQVEETQIAMERKVADNIYVKRSVSKQDCQRRRKGRRNTNILDMIRKIGQISVLTIP